MALKFQQTGLNGAGGASGGTYDHNLLVNRGLPDQHTIESVTGLRPALDRKYERPLTGIPKSDLGFSVVSKEDIDFLKKNDLADIGSQIDQVSAEVFEARGGLDRLKQYIDTKVPYSEYTGGGSSGGHVGSQIGYPLRDKIIATEGQTRFALSKNYRVGTGQLEVYYDGLKMIEGEDYQEIDETTIEMLWPTEAGHMILAEVRAVINSGLHEEYMATKGQTVFKLDSPYGIGENILLVYRNGMLLRKGRDYREVNNMTIEMMSPMLEGDFLTFHQAGATDPMAGNIIDSELGRIKTNLGYTTLSLLEHTQSPGIQYRDMFIDPLANDDFIDKSNSLGYVFKSSGIEVGVVNKKIDSLYDFERGERVNVDEQIFSGSVILKNGLGGADRHSFGPMRQEIPMQEYFTGSSLVVRNRKRDEFLIYVSKENEKSTMNLRLTGYKETPQNLTIVETNGSLSSMQAAEDEEGRIHIVYLETTTLNTVWYAILNRDGSINRRPISPSTIDSTMPHLTVDKNGLIHIVYTSKRMSSTFYNIDYVTLGETLSSVKDITRQAGSHAFNPKVAVGNDMRVRIVFDTGEYSIDVQNLKLVVLEDGLSIYETFITTNTNFSNMGPSLSITKEDVVKIAWRSGRSGQKSGIDYCTINRDNTISGVQAITDGSYEVYAPYLTVDDLGMAHIVFVGNMKIEGTDNVCYAMVYSNTSVSAVVDIGSNPAYEFYDAMLWVNGNVIEACAVSSVGVMRMSKSLANYESIGSFKETFDARAPKSAWHQLSFSGLTPGQTSIVLEYRTSEDEVSWSAWKSSDQMTTLHPVGRYIELRATLTSSSPDLTPELESITIAYEPMYTEVQCVPNVAGKDVDSIIPIGKAIGDVEWFVSRDNGIHFYPAIQDRATEMTGTPSGSQVVLKCRIPNQARLESWGAIW